MSHTHAQNVIHVVFSTKDRRKTISNELQPRMWAYVAGICKNHGIFVHAVGGMDDHIHFLIQVPPPLSLANAVLIRAVRTLAHINDAGEWVNPPSHVIVSSGAVVHANTTASTEPELLATPCRVNKELKP
jgi:REP element-mobilizing transposase RayT